MTKEPKIKVDLEREIIETFLSALKKGMTSEEFFVVADAALRHIKGGARNEVLEKIINDKATPEDVEKMIASLLKQSGDKRE